MKIIDYVLSRDELNSLPAYYKQYDSNAKFLFFDIETTGFVVKNTTLYLIGVLWYEDTSLHIRQWFNDDGASEYAMLTSFIEFGYSFTHLIHFNGNGFDLPYLKQKADILNLSFDLDTKLEQIDIYKEIRNYKNIFALDHMKQTSIEAFLNIHRNDRYTGKELIHIYQKYIAKPSQSMEDLLLLHNHDDLLGMPQISQILHYKTFFEHIDIEITSMKEMEHTLDIHFTFQSIALPKRISVAKNNCYINAIEQKANLQIPLYKGTLKHFFADYKNYFYLPKEDMAIHKSVAIYVDNQNKEKATKQTCYIQKEDVYIPCMDKEYSEQFKTTYHEKDTFQTLYSFINASSDSQKEYIQKILQTFI